MRAIRSNDPDVSSLNSAGSRDEHKPGRITSARHSISTKAHRAKQRCTLSWL